MRICQVRIIVFIRIQNSGMLATGITDVNLAYERQLLYFRDPCVPYELFTHKKNQNIQVFILIVFKKEIFENIMYSKLSINLRVTWIIHVMHCFSKKSLHVSFASNVHVIVTSFTNGTSVVTKKLKCDSHFTTVLSLDLRSTVCTCTVLLPYCFIQ